MSTTTEFKPKTYVLLPHTKPTAPIYQRLNKDQRQRLDKRPNDSAYLKLTFTNNEGKNRTARIKLNCDTIWQDEQIKPEIGIGANEPFTPEERRAVEFTNEICIARKPIVAEYLESIPQFDGWAKNNPNGHSEEKPLYTLLDRESEAKLTNEDTKRRAKAVLKVMDMEELPDLQDLMIRLNGSYFTPPTDVIECQNALVEFIDDADDAMLDKLLSDEVTTDEKVTVLIGRAINDGILSFDAVPNQVSKKKGAGWVSVKEVASSYNPEERKRYFAEFLTSPDGKLLLEDLEKEVGKKETKNNKPKT